MSTTKATPRVIAEAMLASIDATCAIIEGDRDRFTVTMAGTAIPFGEDRPHAFERLASAIEARLAYERATAMLTAAGETGTPLWLVSGSTVLGKWLAWSRIDTVLAKRLVLTDHVDAAPVTGDLARRARRDLGQMAARIRVRGGQAVAERIELSDRIPATATLGDKATIRVARHRLPETVMNALRNDPRRNDRRRVSEVLGHPFFAAHDFMVAGIDNDGGDVVIELETRWEPLAPAPKAAWTAVPRDADPAFPWRPTTRETTELYRLARRGEILMEESVPGDTIPIKPGVDPR